MSSFFGKAGIGAMKTSPVTRLQTPINGRDRNSEILSQSSRMNARLSNQKTFFGTPTRPKTAFSNTFSSTLPQRKSQIGGAASFFEDRSFYIPSEKEREANPQLSLELLRTMTPKNCIKHLDNNPVFMKAMSTTGYVDNEIVSSVSISLTQAELQKFLTNLTFETNLYSAINVCRTIPEVEKKIASLIPIEKAIYWKLYENSGFLFAETIKTVLKRDNTILKSVFSDGKDLVFSDVESDPNFNAQSDSLICNGKKTMVLLPVRSDNNSIIAILQVIGFKRQMNELEAEFPPYYIGCLKIIRDIIEKKFTKQIVRGIPNNISLIFKGIDRGSVSYTVQQITNFFMQTFKCQAADIYQYNEKTKELTRLKDKTVYGSVKEGGIAYHTAVTRSIVIVPDGYIDSFDFVCSDVDGLTESKATLSVPMFYMQRVYVVTLRGKEDLPSFTFEDSMLMQNISPIVTDAIRVAVWLETQLGAAHDTVNYSSLITIACDALSETAEKGKDKWQVLKESSKKIFGSDIFYVASFDGRNMTLSPNGGTAKFEECAAGLSYNYRDVLRTKRGEKNFNEEMYKSCEVEVNETLCFPYRANGRVAGAIEVINPKEDISEEGMNVFSDLCGLLYTQ